MDPLKPESERAPTVQADGKRRWIYPDRRDGAKSRIRRPIAYFLILVFLATPFLSMNSLPLFRIDIISGVVSFFGQAFRFHDASYTVFFFVIFAMGLFIVTAVRGRVWCGYACPQTVWIDWVVRPIEEFIEGPAAKRKVADSKPISLKKVFIKTTKHGLFLALALFLSHVLLAYFVAPEVLITWVTHSPAEHWHIFIAVLSVASVIYFDIAFFREQFCAFLCPYARFQTIMMDDHTPVVAYDAKRGEPRGRRSTEGDCINCNLCVRVCPTGIDIRNGLQLECIQCARCVDACNIVMKTLKRPPNLIKEASAHALSTGKDDSIKEAFSRPRVLVFTLFLIFIVSIFGYKISTRKTLEFVLTRQPGTTYSVMDKGVYANIFRIEVVNTIAKEQTIQITSQTPEVDVICSGCGHPLKEFGRQTLSLVITTKNLSTQQVEIRIEPTHELMSLQMILPKN